MKRLTDIMSRLRSDEGCPWDKQQTLSTLKQYLIEECYELVDAIDSGDSAKHKDELSDILLQVLFQSQIRKEEGKFTFDDVADALADKLIRRHPHVFGEEQAETPAQVLKRWEEIKSHEKKDKARYSITDGIPRHLPSLMKAQRVQERAARVGFDWAKAVDVADKIEEETKEVRQALASGDLQQLEDEIGDLLFAAVNLSRFMKISAEEALDRAVARFAVRFGAVEERVRREGRKVGECTPDELNVHWEAVKKESRQAPG